MSSVTCHISMSLEGFAAGPNQSVESPIGEGGMRLHEWVSATDGWREQHGLDGGERNADAEVVDDVVQGVGAYIMGRKTFGGGELASSMVRTGAACLCCASGFQGRGTTWASLAGWI